MSTSNSKILEFFARIPKLETDGSNWVIFKDRFLYAAAAASLISHVDGTEVIPPLVIIDPGTPTAEQLQKFDEYNLALSKWKSDEAIIKQAIATVIPDSLFIEVRKKETAFLMWEAVKNQREKKSRMVTVDMRRRLQAEKCAEHRDVRVHLNKLLAMREDLASMGGSINDEDFTSIVLGSIPQSYDTYIAAITAASTLLDQTLSPTNIIDAIRDEADRRTIKNPKSRKDDQDAAFIAGQSSEKGKKFGKKWKKGIECYNCHKKGHIANDCWAPGGGAEGKGPKQKSKGKGKEKEVAAKVDEKESRRDDDSDAVWMALAASDGDVDVTRWVMDCGGGDGVAEYELWTEDEIAADEFDEQASTVDIDYSPMSTGSENSEHSIFDVSDLVLGPSNTSVDDEAYADSLPDLISISDSLDSNIEGVENNRGAESVDANESGDSLSVDEPLMEDLGDEPISTFMAATLANPSISSSSETELYYSGASRHMSPYKYKFINYVPIQTKVLTAADGGTFNAIGKGDIRITMPNGQSTTRILLKDVLYAPKMGITLLSISKIDAAGFASLFYKGFLKIFSFVDGKKCLAEVAVRNGLYRVEHEASDVVAAVAAEVVTIEKLHRLMGNISPDAAKMLVKKGMVEGLTLDESSKIESCDSCEYGKAHRKAIGKERVAPQASNIGDEVHSDVWGPSPVQTIGGREYYTTFTDGNSSFTHLYLLRFKSETFDAYKAYEAELKKQKGVGIKKLHSDRGGEYLSKEFTDHLRQAGTLRNLTVHDTPEHNGVAERLNRTLLEKVRAMLHASQLPKFLWGEAIKHAVWLKNRSSTKPLGGRTPYEIFYGTKPNLRGLPEFGSKVWVHMPEGSKLDGRSVIGRWVGFDEESSGHRIYSPEKRMVSIQRSIKFDPGETDVYLPHNVPLEGEKVKGEQSIVPSSTVQSTVDPLGENFEQLPSLEGRPKRIQTESAAIRRLRAGEGVISDLPRERGQLHKGIQEGDTVEFVEAVEPDLYSVMAAAAVVGVEVDELEPSYDEALQRHDWPKWKEAIDVELGNLKAAGTWKVVERPHGTNVVDSKWVF